MPKVEIGQYAEKDINFSRIIRVCVTRTGPDLKKLVS